MIKKKLKILFVCSYFFPDTAVAAVRLSNFAINLNKFGHNIDVLCYGKIDMKKDELLLNKIKDIKVHYIHKNEYTTYRGKNIFVKICNKVKQLLFNCLPESFKVSLNEHTVKHKLDEFINYYNKFLFNNKYDIIFSSYGEKENLYFADYISKKIGCPYIADFRDGIAQNVNKKYSYNIYKKQEEYFIDNATAATYVNETMHDIALDYCNNKNKLYTLYNGYEKLDIKRTPHEKLVFCFTGNAFYKMQTFIPLFKALKELQEEKRIDVNNISILHAGVSNKIIKEAIEFNLLDIVKDYGYVNSKTIYNIQMESDIFLNLIWNIDRYSSGIISGKFYEGIRAELPILTISVGQGINGELYKLNQKYDFGFCYEEGRGKVAFNDLKKWIVDCYNKKMEKADIFLSYPEKVKEDFCYENLTKQLECIMYETIERYKLGS